MVAERFSSADFLHGPIAMVEPNFPVFVFAPPGVTWGSIGGILNKLRVGGPRLWPLPIRQSRRAGA